MIFRFTNGRVGNAGASLVVTEGRCMNGTCLEIDNFEPAERTGWLFDAFTAFLIRHEIALDIIEDLWNEVFYVLRSDFGRLPTSAWYGSTALEIAEVFLHSLEYQPEDPVLIIYTGLDDPHLIGYLLDESIIKQHLLVDESRDEHTDGGDIYV